MLTKTYNIQGDHIEYDATLDEESVVEISSGDSVFCSLSEAREIHAELTELFTILDEKV